MHAWRGWCLALPTPRPVRAAAPSICSASHDSMTTRRCVAVSSAMHAGRCCANFSLRVEARANTFHAEAAEKSKKERREKQERDLSRGPAGSLLQILNECPCG